MKANSPIRPNYEPSKESNYILYEDANNLNAWALMQSLPYNNLKLNKAVQQNQILKPPDNNSTSYIEEVDL
ncbi:MAG: hypothetical protein ACKPKO_57525 [Candidatus Fonsibacter sp.]